MTAPCAAAAPGAGDASREHLAGVLCAASGAVAWSLGALIIRLIEVDAWTILFWRSLSITLGALALVLAMNRGALFAAIRASGWGAAVAGLTMAVSMMLYVNSITRTSVANSLILLSTNPFMAAILAWGFLGERVPARTWAIMAVALLGMAAMVGDSVGGGAWLGDALAIGCAATFAVTMVVLRRFKHVDMTPQVMMAGLWATVLVFPLAAPLTASARDILLCVFMGIFSLGLGMVLFVRGLRSISAAEAGLISMLESILAPIWVWIALGERPRPLALLGGVIVLGAVAAQALLSARPQKPAQVGP
jgi:drug/metabolite transporter (DMT)-like permease